MSTNKNSHINKLLLHNYESNKNESKEHEMKVAASTISFQSKANPKVKITLEFVNLNDKQQEEFSNKSEDELKNILKHMWIEKIKQGAFQTENPAVECTPHKITEVKENE